MSDIAWYDGNSGGITHPVGEKHPNAYGLYDMLGNVWEWCGDNTRKYQDEEKLNPFGRNNLLALFAYRGGSWFDDACYVRCACRDHNAAGHLASNLGFRVFSSVF